MSTTVRGFGFMAVLANPVTDKSELEELCEKLYDSSTNLDINYEGTIVCMDVMRYKKFSEREEIYHLSIGNQETGDPRVFLNLCKEHNLSILPSTILPWSGIWYTGSDSPQNEVTLEQFKKQLPS